MMSRHLKEALHYLHRSRGSGLLAEGGRSQHRASFTKGPSPGFGLPPPPSIAACRGQRFYHIQLYYNFQHFRSRGFGGRSGRQWSTRQYVLLAISTTGLCTAVYYSHREVVPYTYRKHFVLLSPDFETQLAESQFQSLKEEWKPIILHPFHPETIRVRRIARDIIRAVMEGLLIEDSQAIQLEHGGMLHTPRDADTTVLMWQNPASFAVSSQWGSGKPALAEWGNDKEALDDGWMNQTRKKGLMQGAKPYVKHLKKAKWEVLVVDKDVVNAFCLPGGKIVVFTGLLKRFPTDEEFATVLGHEVAHVVARHGAERMTRHLYITLVQLLVLAFFYAPDIVQSASILFLELPFSRRQELEADHIGLLLMAAAGYDPRVAPHVYEKLGELGGKTTELLQYVTTHPSGKKRGERLRQTGTMEQALRIYEQRTRGTVVEGFLRDQDIGD